MRHLFVLLMLLISAIMYSQNTKNFDKLLDSLEKQKNRIESNFSKIYVLKQSIHVQEYDSKLAPLAKTLNTGDTISITDYSADGFYEIRYSSSHSSNGILGYVNETEFVKDTLIISFQQNLKKIENIKIRIDSMNQVKRKNSLIKRFGNKYGVAIANNEIMLGMSKEMVIESWGNPDNTNKTVGSWGVHEQLVYGNSQYVYIENGKVKSWQSKE